MRIVVAVAYGGPRNYAYLSTIKILNSSFLAYGLVYGLKTVKKLNVSSWCIWSRSCLNFLRHWCRDQDTAEQLLKMGEDLKRLISVRGAYRGHCTRAIKAANEIMELYSPNLDTLEDVVEGLCSRMERLSLQNQKIELAVPEDKIEEEITQTLEYTDDLMGQKNKIAKAQVKQEQEEKKLASSKFTTKKEAIHVKLPKMKLKSFSGNPIEWLSFWDSFQASVDKNSDISGVDKMNYLSGLLKGEAARVIQGLPLSESNYKRAVDLLKEGCGQKQVLINAHMDALLKIPAATNDVKKLRSLYDACEGYIHGLESLDVYPESYGDLLIPIVMKKLPEEVRRIMLRSHDETTWTLADLRKQLRHEVETREKSSLGQSDKEVSIPSSLLLVLCSLVPWEERTPRMAVRFVMGPTPRTRVRSSRQLARDSNFSATRKGVSGALRQVICQSPAT